MRNPATVIKLLLSLAAFVAQSSAQATETKPSTRTVHGLALYGEPKYGPDFNQFDYVNPDAPKGGIIHFSGSAAPGSIGSYDSFNPFVARGVSAINILNLTLVYDRLMEPSFDEIQSQYGLLAETLTYPNDYAWAEYKLRPNARWQDGKPVTSEDVVFTYEILKEKGSPAFSYLVKDAAKAEVTGPRTVRFTFAEKNNRRSLISLGLLAVVPKHYWQARDFSAPVVEPPLTSGPYRVTDFDLGRSVTLERDPNYWGKDVPLNVGRFNYGKIVMTFYRDPTVAFEGFKAGDTDVRFETSEKNWAIAYTFPAYKHGHVVRDVLAQRSGFGHAGYYFNLRSDKFKDPVLREALAYAFDFTWLNKNLFYDSRVRSESYFGYPGTELAAAGLPTKEELALIGPYREMVPPRVFTRAFKLPDTDGTQESLRDNLRHASQMLAQAGYKQKNGKLQDPQGRSVQFEILAGDPSYQLPTNQWIANLKLIGIDASLRVVDLAQYIERQRKYDFEVVVAVRPGPPLPGPELRNAWSSQSADVPGSFAWSGVKSPVVDALVERIIAAQSFPELLNATHALDRVLSWNFYSVPLYSPGGKTYVAYWDRIGRPKLDSPFGWPWLNAWWIDPKKDAAFKLATGQN